MGELYIDRRTFLEFALASGALVSLGGEVVFPAKALADDSASDCILTFVRYVNIEQVESSSDERLTLGLYNPNSGKYASAALQDFPVSHPPVESLELELEANKPTETGIPTLRKYTPAPPIYRLYGRQCNGDLVLPNAFNVLNYFGSTNSAIADLQATNVATNNEGEPVFSNSVRNDGFVIKTGADGVATLYVAFFRFTAQTVDLEENPEFDFLWKPEVLIMPVRVKVGSGISDKEDAAELEPLSDNWIGPLSTTSEDTFFKNQRFRIGHIDPEEDSASDFTISKIADGNTIVNCYRLSEEFDPDNDRFTFAWTTRSDTTQDGWDWHSDSYRRDCILPSFRIVDMEGFDFNEVDSWKAVASFCADISPYEDGRAEITEGRVLISNKCDLGNDSPKLENGFWGFESELLIDKGVLKRGHEYAIHMARLPQHYLIPIKKSSVLQVTAPTYAEKDYLFRFRTADAIEATGVKLNEESLLMAVPNGDTFATFTLKATITTEDGTGNSTGGVTWVSSDESIATVDENGLVTALATGEAVITATAAYPEDGSVFDECAIKVVVPPESVSFGKDAAASVFVGSTFSLADPVVEPAGAYFESIEWASSDPEVAVYADGKVSTLAEGAATISATLMGLNGIIVPDEAQTPPLSANFMVDVLLAPYDGSNTGNDQGGLQAGSGSPTSGAENGTGGVAPLRLHLLPRRVTPLVPLLVLRLSPLLRAQVQWLLQHRTSQRRNRSRASSEFLTAWGCSCSRLRPQAFV